MAVGGTATIHGKGMVNGASGYTYQVVAVDGQPDALRVQVWSRTAPWSTTTAQSRL